MKKLLARFKEVAHRAEKDEKGAINMGGILMMGIGMVFLAVGFIMLPISTTATDSILAYAYSANAAITVSTYTGLSAIAGITPLLILLGFITQAVVVGFLGFRVMEGQGSTRFTPGSLILLSLGIVFIAVGLIIFPVVLDGVSAVLHNGGNGLSASYTGYTQLLYVTPMLVLLGYIAASVITGFFGIKSLQGDY